MTEHRSLASLSDFKTHDSTLSESLRRKVRGETSSPSGRPTDQVHRISCFIRPKNDKDGGARSEELVSLVYDSNQDVSTWLEEVTILLRDPIRGSNSFPKSPPLSQSTYIVALYSLDISTYPASLDRIYNFDAILNNILPKSTDGQQCFFLRSIDQHVSGMNEIGGEWFTNELKLLKEEEAKKGVPAGGVVNLNVGGMKSDDKADGSKEDKEGAKEGTFKQDLLSFARHCCFKLACAVEASAREEIPPDLLAKWLIGGLDRPPILRPAYWSCFATLIRDRALSDPNRAIIPLSSFLGACFANGAAKCDASVVRDQPTSKARVHGEQSARYSSRADPRGLGMHFLEQASFTTIDESDDTTYACPRKGTSSIASPLSKLGMGSKSFRGGGSILEEDSSLGDMSSNTGDISERNSQSSLDASSMVSSISVNSYEDGTSVVGMPRVRYTEFNDRSNVECGFYCSCLSCKPDPDLQNDDEEVYGLGAVRFWWYADWYPSREMDAYKVGNQYTERSAVRRIALGQPVYDALKGAPLPFVIRRRRRQTAFLKAVRMNDGSDTSLPTIADAVSSAGTSITGGMEDDEGEEEETDTGLEEMKKMMRMQGALHLCSDINCPVRRQELTKAGAKMTDFDDDEDDNERHSHEKDENKEKLMNRSSNRSGKRSKDGGKKDGGKNGEKVVLLADNNPLKAMQVGFGVHHKMELEEENGLKRVSLPFNVPDVRVDLLDTIVANGVVARIWFARGVGLAEKSFSSESTFSNKSTNESVDMDGESSIAGGGSIKSANTRGSVASSLPNINANNSNDGEGSVASSLVEQHEEEANRNAKKEKTVKPEDIPQQHYIDWESLHQSKRSSKWHGPFNSDGAAHRHLHNSLDFSHVIFEVLLRQPFSMRLKLLHALISSTKVSLKQRANFGLLVDNASKILKDKEEALSIMKKRIKLRNKSLRWQLPILLYTPSRKHMQMAHYTELQKKMDKIEREKQLMSVQFLSSDFHSVSSPPRVASPDYASLFLRGGQDSDSVNSKKDKSFQWQQVEVGGEKRSLRRGSHAPLTETSYDANMKLQHRMGLLSGAAKTAGLMSRLNMSAKRSASIDDGNDIAVSHFLEQVLAKGKDKYGAGYLSKYKLNQIVSNMRGSKKEEEDKPSVKQVDDDEEDDEDEAVNEFDEEDEKLDSLIDLSVELFRNKCIRSDQVLLLLESLTSPVNKQGSIDTSEARSVAMPDLHSDEIRRHSHHKSKKKNHLHSHKDNEEYDPESVMIACRLLLTGIGYCLDTVGDQADASATKHDLLNQGSCDIWRPNLNAGVSFGGHANSHITHGHKGFTPGYSMVNGVPVSSLPQVNPNPRHVGALSRIMRMISEAASSFTAKEEVVTEPQSASHSPALKKASSSSVYSPCPTLSPYQKEPLLRKMWDEEDYNEPERPEGHSSEDKTQPKLKIYKRKEDKEDEGKKTENMNVKTSSTGNDSRHDRYDKEVSETLTSAAKFLHLVRKLKWDVKVATGIDRESYLKQIEKEKDMQMKKDMEEGKSSTVIEEDEDSHTFVDVASQGSEFQDFDSELGPPPHNYVRGLCRTPKEKKSGHKEVNDENKKKQSEADNEFFNMSSLESEETGSNVGSWICPITSKHLWREDRIHHLLSHPVASVAYIESWKKAFENLKKVLKQTHIRRRALLIHRQAHMSFAEALCCLIDCKGNENLVFERLGNSNSTSNSQVKPPPRSQLEASVPERCGDCYKAEMRLGASLIGNEASQWVSEKRVRKEFKDIQNRDKSGIIKPETSTSKNQTPGLTDESIEKVADGPDNLEEWW